MKSYTIMTLGCKVNQCESAALAHLLDLSGAEPRRDNEPAELVIINTCTVTGKAAMQSRQAIRQAIRNHPAALIVVTGCYAQTAAEEIRKIPGVDLIVGHQDKLFIPKFLDQARCNAPKPMVMVNKISQCRDFEDLPGAAPEGRTRAFLKIQDGCSAMCTYCIVPHARGRSRSMPTVDVYNHLAALGKSGCHEAVLTGIHLGAYGTDLNPPTNLIQLIEALGSRQPIDRIRLSSIEPTEVDNVLLQQIAASDGFICHHLHIPLQSGDNGVLRRMGRPYTRELFSDLVHAIRERLPFSAIGADVLIGFPGEDEAAFNQTRKLIEALPLTYLHVFPFSARKGTPAANFKEQVPQRIVKNRCRMLRDMGQKKKKVFLNALIGRTVEVLVQCARDPQSGCSSGLSHNYVTVHLQDVKVEANQLVKAKIQAVRKDLSIIGEVL